MKFIRCSNCKEKIGYIDLFGRPLKYLNFNGLFEYAKKKKKTAGYLCKDCVSKKTIAMKRKNAKPEHKLLKLISIEVY